MLQSGQVLNHRDFFVQDQRRRREAVRREECRRARILIADGKRQAQGLSFGGALHGYDCRLGAVVDLGENTDAKGKRCQKARHRPSYFGRLLQDNPRLFAFLFHAPYLSGQGQVLQRASG